MVTESRENLVISDTESANAETSSQSNAYDSLNEETDYVLTQIEKSFLLSAERGDCATVRRYNCVEHKNKREFLFLWLNDFFIKSFFFQNNSGVQRKTNRV